MTERDLERVLQERVQDVHLSDEARRRIRLATKEKEERPVRMKKFVAIALAVLLALSVSIGIAEELGMFDFLSRVMGQEVLPGANDLVQSNLATGETEHVTYNVKQAMYDGKSVSMLVEMRAKDEKTFLMCDNWSPDEQIGWYDFFIKGIDPNDERTFSQYAADNGYTQFAVAFVNIDMGDISAVEEWDNNVLTVLYSFAAEGDELVLPFEYYSRIYTNETRDDPQCVQDSITLKAAEPLWTVSSDQSFDAPGFGIRVDGITITGTPVQSYWAISYTVTDAEIARNLGWNTNVVDMNKKYLPSGVLGVFSGPLPTENGQQIVDYGSFAAMAQPPEQLMILLRNWDDHDLNNYFPITLK